jgi:hypothetical protein
MRCCRRHAAILRCLTAGHALHVMAMSTCALPIATRDCNK